MKKAVLYYFSGTGNTRLCAKYIAKYLTLEGEYEVTHYEYKAPINNVPDPNDFDLIGIGFPIHAFNAPKAFHDFCKKLPSVNHKPLFFFRCSGEPYHFNDAAASLTYKHLKKKGYELIMDQHFILPYNIMFRYKDEVVKQQMLYIEPLCHLMAKRISLGEKDQVKYKIRHKILSFFLRIEWIAPVLNSTFAHMNKKCIDCGLCIKNCPNNAIIRKSNGKLTITSKCTMCMRCTMYCPKDAITFGFMNLWKVNGPYHLNDIKDDKSINSRYINQETKGYFKLFYPYFKKADEALTKYDIKVDK